MAASWDHSPEIEQKLAVLADFEAEVKDHPSNAVSFATTRFLDTLATLIHEQDVTTKKKVVHAFTSVFPHAFKTICQNEGETRMWQSIVALKSHILPLLAHHPNQGVKVAVAKLMQVVILVQSKREAGVPPTGKAEISLALVHPTHRVLKVQELEEEAKTTLNSVIAILRAEGLASTTVTAIINSFGPLLRNRPQYTRVVLQALASWSRPLPPGLPPPQVRSVEKTIKNLLGTFMRAEQLIPYRPEILKVLGAVGGNVAMFQRNQVRGGDDPRRNAMKRPLPSLPGDVIGVEKKTKMEDQTIVPPPPPSQASTSYAPPPTNANSLGVNMGVFAGFDFTTLPLQIVVELCVATLLSVSNEQLAMAITNARQTLPQSQPPIPTAPVGSSQPKRDPRLRRDPRLQQQQAAATASPTPPPPVAEQPPPMVIPTLAFPIPEIAQLTQVPALPPQLQISQPQPQSQLMYPDIKSEPEVKLPFAALESDQTLSAAAAAASIIAAGSRSPLHQSQQQPPPATLQERALQSFKIQPFTLKPPSHLTFDQCKKMMHLAFRRIFDAENAISAAAGPQPIAVPETVTPGSLPTKRAGPGAMTRNSWMLILTRLVTRGVPHCDADATDTAAAADIHGDSVMDLKPDVESEGKPSPPVSADEMRELLLRFILDDFRDRSELVIHWLHDEWYQDLRASRDRLSESPHEPNYFRWLLRLLKGVVPLLDAKDRAFTRLLLDAPELNGEAVALTGTYLEDPEKVVMGIDALQNLIALRPPVRDACLDLLLGFCLHTDFKIRSNAISAAEKWVPDHAEISAKVERYALETMRALSDASPLESRPSSPVPSLVTDGEDATVPDVPPKQEWTEHEVLRRLELFLALCSKKQELLSELFPVHANASDFVQRTIRQVIKGLIKSIGPQSPKLLNIIRNFPPGGDRLVIRILVVLTDTVRPSPELVKTVKAVFVERDLDAKFLIPIISGLTKDEIKQYLPRIVALLDGTPMQNQVVKRVFSRITTGVGNTSPPISSQDLLMALHDMEGIPPQKVVEAINVCFNMSEAFKSEIIAVVLQQLIDQPKIPGLSMMTIIRSVQVYKNLTGFVMSLLAKLIQRKVWNDPKLWTGFIKCCERTQPQSIRVLATLPRQQLKDVITKVPAMEKPVREYAEKGKHTRVLQALDEVMVA